MAANGFQVLLMDRPYPTPYVSFEVRRRKLVGGIMITASHNPPTFNGFKVKAHFGGSATPGITAQIESNLGKTGGPRSASATARSLKQSPPLQTAEFQTVRPERFYIDHLKSLVDWDRIAKSKLKIVVDSMHGCGGYILEEMLRDTSCSVNKLHPTKMV